MSFKNIVKYDITFCSNQECDNFDCERNMVNVDPDDPEARWLSIAMCQGTDLCPLSREKENKEDKDNNDNTVDNLSEEGQFYRNAANYLKAADRKQRD